MRTSKSDRYMLINDQHQASSPLYEGGGGSIIDGSVGGGGSDNSTMLSITSQHNAAAQLSCNNEPMKHQNIDGNFLCSPSPPTNTNQKTSLHNSQTIFSWNKNEEFHFDVPPEAPIFTPTESEFKNPLTYISKIRPIAEKYGICKIKPPAAWQPPFTVDVDKLRFTPRIQRLNELEAKTRVKLNFLDQIAKFWELQGSSLKIPMVERKALDLYSLHRIVQEEGGLEQTINNRKWSKVAARLGYPQGKSVGTILKSHYERILYPFDVYTSGKMDPTDIKLEVQETDEHDYKPHCIESRQQVSPPQETTARRSKRFAQNNQTFTAPIEIKKEFPLKIGSSIFKSPVKVDIKSRMHSRNMSVNIKTEVKRRIASDPLAKYICHTCNRGDVEESMLLCDGCDDSYHTFCLIPPLSDIPKGDWRCPKCVVEEVNKPIEAFGFEQAQREYTLQQFGEMADQFKSDYFNMPVHLVPTELVEREFWRIVSSIDEDVTVEYGADLHTMDHGSGFPTKSSLYLLPGDQEYAESSWNLNNLPLLEESILGHINADISGMKVPWMYVGMCFATFCWHNEDHWSYSINYLHWGEPKTWYGVPGTKAELFEETMKSAAPELFHSQPDLLHQLVTIMNPNILMNAGVPVYRTDQHAGEFVITFPRAYHAGFNQGYNFAEAVNFAPADWMKMGRECINHYSTLRRFCVFSHDELVCKMALDPDRLNFGIATACYLDMAEMVDSEKKLRKLLLEWGVTKAEREAFELIQDDERQCEICKTTCFLSAVGCSCSKNIVCLRHFSELCKCAPDRHTLQYRYTLDELPLMLRKLKVKAESFENWLKRIRDVINPNTVTTITLDELQELAQEAKERKFPNSILLERLNSAVLEAEKCVTVIQQLDINKMRTRTRNSCENTKYKLTMEELDMFVHEIDNLWCVIKEGNSVRELQEMGKEFMDNAAKLLSTPINELLREELENAIDEGSSLCIELPEIFTLKDRLCQVAWYYEVRQNRESTDKIPLVVLKRLLDDGMKITPHNIIERELADLDIIIASVSLWEAAAQECFKIYTENHITEIENHLKKADLIEGILPSYNQLKDALKKVKEWVRTVEILQSNENYPYFHTLENVVNRGKNIPFQLVELKKMEEHLASARSWKDRTSRTFLRKKTQFSLMEALSPRIEPVMFPRRRNEGENSFCKKFTEEMSPVQMVVAFKEAEEKEIRGMIELRKTNCIKNPETDLYCVCKRNFSGIMYNCQLCNNWFHAQCVPPPKNTVRPRPLNSTTPNLGINIPISNRDKDIEVKYLCQSCLRSRRPRLETILSLLVSLQRLPIRIPEGEALQCLTERAMNWQDRARQLLTSEQITKAIEKLSELDNIISSTQSTNIIQPPIITTTTTITNPIKNKRKSSLTSRIKDSGTATETSSDEDDFPPQPPQPSQPSQPPQPLPTSSNILSSTDNGAPSPTNIEHAYSVLTPISAGDAPQPDENCDQIENSKPPLIAMDSNVVTSLEDLMMEGDLLEVSLDETNLIWRLLNATKPSYTDLSYIHYKYKIKPVTTIEPSLFTIKKRKSNDYLKQQIKLPKLTDIVITPVSSPTINTTVLTTGLSTAISTAENMIISPNIPPTSINQNQTAATMSTVITTSSAMVISSAESSIIESKNQFKNYIKMNSTKRGRKLKLGQAFATLAQENNLKKKLKKNRKKKAKLARSMVSSSSVTVADIFGISSNIDNSSDDDDDDDEDDDDDDEDDDCSAVTCVRPSGREVDWVQCDGGCDKWFHMLCVGLNKNQIKPDDDFICHKCKNKKPPPQKFKIQKNDKPTSNSSCDTPLITDITPPPLILTVSTTTLDIGEEIDDKAGIITTTTTTTSGVDNDDHKEERGDDDVDTKEICIITTTTAIDTNELEKIISEPELEKSDDISNNEKI